MTIFFVGQVVIGMIYLCVYFYFYLNTIWMTDFKLNKIKVRILQRGRNQWNRQNPRKRRQKNGQPHQRA